MPKYFEIKTINRIIDVNINRTKEGLRVCEEIARFTLNSRNLTLGFKKIRHKVNLIFKFLPTNVTLLKERQSVRDVGKNIFVFELQRKNYQDIFFANIQRIKESIRVLEEFSKLKNINLAIKFKKIRYDIYEIEKKAVKRISALRHFR